MKKHAESVNVQAELMRTNVMFTMSRRGWSGSCKVKGQDKEDKVQVEADKRRLGISKTLIDCPEFDAIWDKMGEIYQWVSWHSMPAIRKGFYFVKREVVHNGSKVNNIELYEAMIAGANRVIHDTLVPAFIAVYDKAIEAARASKDDGGLGNLFNPDDYPEAEELREWYSIEYSWLTWDVASMLPPEVAERENQKLQREFEDVRNEAREFLRTGFATFLRQAVERLQGVGEFSGKMFRNDALNTFNQFVDTFNSRDITNDTDLSGLVEQIRGIMRTFPDAGSIRDSAQLRDEYVRQFGAVSDQFSTMIINKPKRKFRLQ